MQQKVLKRMTNVYIKGSQKEMFVCVCDSNKNAFNIIKDISFKVTENSSLEKCWTKWSSF